MRKIFLTNIAILLLVAANAQYADSLSAKDYANAEQFLYYKVTQKIDRGAIKGNWMQGDKFWYRVLTPQGSEFILVDATKGTRSAAFDQQKLATALSLQAGKTYTANMLPFTNIEYTDDGKSILFNANAKRWKADLKTYALTLETSTAAAKSVKENELLSPDGSKAAFIKDYNLWVRDIATNQLTQLTTDGMQYFGYATDNAGWKHSDNPILRWSPDSKKIATFQQDERKTGDMYLVSTNVGHPLLQQWKYPLPGDSNIIMIERVIINVHEPKVIRLQVDPDPHRGTLSDDISSSGTFDDVDWSSDENELAFVSTTRDHKTEKFRIANTATGEVREVFEETVTTQYESGQGAINWRYLSNTHEVIWYSERDNWGHLYLYDATTGKLKNQITKGEFVVTQMLKADEQKRQIYFLACGKDAKNPYFTHFFRIDFDGKNLVDLTPETGNHSITLSESENYFIDNYSQTDVPNVIVMRNLNGKNILTLEKTDVSRLQASGWKPPIPITLKAHDGETNVYGLMFTPTHFDSTKKYPVIDYIYPGPQGGSVGSWSFVAARGDNQALAELGFIVIEIEGTSNPLRSKSFHDMNYGFMADNTLPDQIAGIRQLAQLHSFMDTTRIGIWGHSGGGFATACAMFRYPDFFKVGISESGNHDNREYEDDWGERYIGLVNGNNYEMQANQVYAKNLKGKLLLAHGLMDDNVPPNNTLLVIKALEAANKDYDLIVFPDSHHGYGIYSGYMMRRRWDYFVKNLLGMQPPKEYELKMVADPRNAVN
ncbi:MAG: DPP IV N-terminal domain-containing protein [Parafilimonas sp.]|nr:DPP IV N-terminal domain-containing protein [Parafilimonas sp.]